MGGWKKKTLRITTENERMPRKITTENERMHRKDRSAMSTKGKKTRLLNRRRGG